MAEEKASSPFARTLGFTILERYDWKNKIQDPTKLKRLIELTNVERWTRVWISCQR
jgi:hypothetical protein